MNKHRYLWTSLNILNNPSIILWLRWGSEYTWSSDMFDWLLKMRRILNGLEFWSWHGCICKGYTEFSICLNMAQYDSVTTENVLISLNMPENTWMNCFDYARVYKMSHLRNLTWFWAFLTDLSKAFDCLFHELMPTALVSFIIIYLTGNKELRLIMISVHEKWFYLECLKVLCLGPHYPISVLVICFL